MNKMFKIGDWIKPSGSSNLQDIDWPSGLSQKLSHKDSFQVKTVSHKAGTAGILIPEYSRGTHWWVNPADWTLGVKPRPKQHPSDDHVEVWE